MSSYIKHLRTIFDESSELLTVEETINAMRLANCLVLNGDLQEALSCLNDVVYFECKDKSEEHWTWNVFGLAILSELACKTKENDYEIYYSALRSYTWLPNDSLAYAYKVLSNHDGTMTLPAHSSMDDVKEHHSVCEEFCDEILELRYLYEYFFMAKKPSFFMKYRLRGIRTAKSESAAVLLREMKVSLEFKS